MDAAYLLMLMVQLDLLGDVNGLMLTTAWITDDSAFIMFSGATVRAKSGC